MSSESLASTNGAFQALNSARALFEDMRKASKKSPTLQLPVDYSVLSAITKRIHNYQSHQKAIASIPPLMPGSPSSAPSPREVSLFLLRLRVFVVLMNFIIASQEAFF